MFLFDGYLRELLTALRTEERIMLATIISTSGSTPAAVFSKMLLKNNGSTSLGTVGGGCMEGDVLLLMQRCFDADCADSISFTLNEDDMENGLICGGNLSLFIEPLTKIHIPLIEEIYTRRNNGDDTILVTRFDSQK